MENKSSFIKAFPFTWLITFIVTLILWLVFSKVEGVSFLLGSATSLMTMSMLYKSVYKFDEKNVSKAQKKAVANYAFRFLIYAIVLIVSALFDGLSIYATAGGLLTFKIVLQVLLFVEKNGDKND
jgi:F0F1-type ATP synthase assembly protein I